MCINLIIVPTRPFISPSPLTAFTAISIPYLLESSLPQMSVLPVRVLVSLPFLISLYLSLLLLSGNIYLNPGPSLSHLLLCTLNTRSCSLPHTSLPSVPYWQLRTWHPCYNWALGLYHYKTCRIKWFHFWLISILRTLYLHNPSLQISISWRRCLLLKRTCHHSILTANSYSLFKYSAITLKLHKTISNYFQHLPATTFLFLLQAILHIS